MKKIGIFIITTVLIITLSSCTNKEIDFFDCVYDNSCMSAGLYGDEDSDSEPIKFLHSKINEFMNITLVQSETFVDYDEYEVGDIRLTVVFYQINSPGNSINIQKFKELFTQIQTYFSGKSMDIPYFKVELRTKDSFKRCRIVFDDETTQLSYMQVPRIQYSSISETQKDQINTDIASFNLFDRVSYDFIYSDYNILFNHESTNQTEIDIKVILQDDATETSIPLNQIESFYTSFIDEKYTLNLEKDE